MARRLSSRDTNTSLYVVRVRETAILTAMDGGNAGNAGAITGPVAEGPFICRRKHAKQGSPARSRLIQATRNFSSKQKKGAACKQATPFLRYDPATQRPANRAGTAPLIHVLAAVNAHG